MGQALRRATARLPTSKPPPPPPPPEVVKSVERRPPSAPAAKTEPSAAVQDRVDVLGSESISNVRNEDRLLEERDPGYDAMLSKMVGAIKSRPGGKLEMGEAFIVEKYNRPLPKLRTSKADSGSSEQYPLAPGTLNAAQLREIILLYQGKYAEHQGAMGIDDIAKRFRIDAAHVERIVQFLSMPPENRNENTQR